MAVGVELVDDCCRLTVDGSLTLQEAAELTDLKGWLIAAMDRYARIELDLAQTQQLDGAGLQLLYAAKKEAQSRQRGFKLIDYAPAHRESLALFHLTA